MFVLICATLLFSVRRITAATVWKEEPCKDGSCVTFSEGEIKAEAGLCVVIPCSFKTSNSKQLVFYKCEPSKQECANSEVIFHSNANHTKTQPRFVGRVSLLQPDLSLKNCSIIINDLTESDSGSYWLRLLDVNKKTRHSSSKVNIAVKGLTQKPTVGIPPLTEGQQTTLSCTAPGLCSGSDPEITWTWRGAGEKDSHISATITAVKTEHLTSVTQRRSSTLTFNPSAEHHGTNVTCKVRFPNYVTTEETVTLNVTYMKKPVISGNTAVKEGDVLRLTCSGDSFPPSRVTWTKLPIKNVLHNVSGAATLLISNVTAECSGQYVCTAEQRITNVTTAAEVTVTYQHGPCEELPWMVIAVVSLVVNIICMILLMFLWNTRKKVTPNQEDRTYMSLQKTHQSPEYDVIARPLN
uniref:sialic acid-binding Ig-like lectin 14 isoform X2 n=1 Tax=Gasterosteus aculeatus aculeatus TaxID=481459 RepID=UPI001A9994AD|nr:sialic acid-binding Ig-like lectin 14 isoform X2 [Gasterosteus aculeatus aculeatus]